jgi:hypothetical protein
MPTGNFSIKADVLKAAFFSPKECIYDFSSTLVVKNWFYRVIVLCQFNCNLTQASTHTRTHAHTRARTYAHTRTHAHIHAHARTDAPTNTYTRAHIRAYTHTRAYTRTHTRAHTPASPQAHTRTRAHTRARLQALKYILLQDLITKFAIILIWFLSPSNTTLYYTENNQLGYMFRPCRGHHQASTMYWSSQYLIDLTESIPLCL